MHRGELVVQWENGRYSPDFYAAIGDRHCLFEVKSDRDVPTPLVQAKKRAAEQWARFVSDNADDGTWEYRLVPEAVLGTARTVAALLNQTARWGDGAAGWLNVSQPAGPSSSSLVTCLWSSVHAKA